MAYVQEKSVYIILVGDFETSSLSCEKGAITQITFEALRSDTLEPIGVFNKYVYPYKKRVINPDKVKTTKSKRAVDAPIELELMEYSPKALQVTGITMEKLYEEGEQLDDVATSFIKWIKDIEIPGVKTGKPLMCGYNFTFDVGFLLQMFEYTGTTEAASKLLLGDKFSSKGNTVWIPKFIDLMPLSRAIVNDRDDVPSTNLETITGLFGIENDDAHNALHDVEVTRQLLSVYIQKIRSEGGGEIEIKKGEKDRVHFRI